MDFDLSEEQKLLADAVERLFSRKHAWAHYAELGLLGLPFAQRFGGSEGGQAETTVVMEAIGAALAREPYLATVVMAGGVLRAAASETQCAGLIPRIAGGKLVMALASFERDSGHDFAAIRTTARREGSAWILAGVKALVIHGDLADKLIVSARVSGKHGERAGIGLFLIEAQAAGVSRRVYATYDGRTAADITFSNARAEGAIGAPEAGLATLERVADETIAALAAEAVGAMDGAFKLTLSFLKSRVQFGRALGGFQVLQHRAVDMMIELEQARSMAMFAAMMAARSDPEERTRAMAVVKVQIGRSARFIGQQAVQLHGAMGLAAECKAGQYLKRLTAIDTLLGDANFHLWRLVSWR